MAREESEAPFRTVEWHQAYQAQQALQADNALMGKMLNRITGKPHSWSVNPLKAFVAFEEQPEEAIKQIEKTEAQVDYKEELAREAVQKAEAAGYENDELNQSARAAIRNWLNDREKLRTINNKYSPDNYNEFTNLFLLFILLSLLFGIGIRFIDGHFMRFVKGFIFVFLIAIIAYTLAGQSAMKTIGFGYAAWAILLGLVISNTIGTPSWAKPAVKTEYYIKTGLVLLGAEILFGKILSIGLPGIFIAWVVTPIVLISTYWFGQRILKITSKTLNITISADMSVCGVSAAVAVAAACKAKKEELTLAIGLSMIFTSVMMILLPLFINLAGMPEILGGAWLGGTIDATGAVVAAGAFLGDHAMTVAATIKMIQNILIGIVAFFVAIYFTMKVEKTGTGRISAMEIWHRFPKFILGFIGASILFSGLYWILGKDMGYSMIDEGVISSLTKNLRGWLFCLAFVSIGLATNFKELKHHFKGGKPLVLYLCGQTFNLGLTLFMAWLMFYIVFPEITEMISR